LASFVIRVFQSEAVSVDWICRSFEKENKEAHNILMGKLWECDTLKTRRLQLRK
jgi:hypothetical protein